MSNAGKYMIFGSMAAAGLVALASLADIFIKQPFRGQIVMDIVFLLAAGIILYLGWDAWQESK